MTNLAKTQSVQRLNVRDIPQQGAIAHQGKSIINNFYMGGDCECSALAQSQTKPRPAEAKPFTGFHLAMCGLAAVTGLALASYWYLDTQYNGAAAREARATTALLEAQSEASKIMAEGKGKAIAEGFQPDALVPNLCP